jgi:uncharacterized protein (DUF1501 family)
VVTAGEAAAAMKDFWHGRATKKQAWTDEWQEDVWGTSIDNAFGPGNGNGGTDHGHAGAMFVIGGSVRGHTVHGRWPGLDREQLHEGRDLALTTDFRTVFSEVVVRHLGAPDAQPVFPGFEGPAALGVL